MTTEEMYVAGMRLSAIGSDRIKTLWDGIKATKDQPGEVWECGAWRGGTALLLKYELELKGIHKTLRLFDTFKGMPHQGPIDHHKVGSFESSYEEVAVLFKELSDCCIHQGVMPASFAGLEDCIISVAHIDVDQEQSVRECLEWVYPRVHSGGYIVIDDYLCKSCPGAKKAVDQFIKETGETLNVAGGTNPQAHFIKQ